jgi:type IV secretion system protein VirB9
MKRLLPLLIGTMLSTPGFALDNCKPSDTDAQVRICTYNPTQRYVIHGLVGFPVNLQFGESEHIKRFEPGYTGVDEKGNPTPTWAGPQTKGEQISAEKFRNNLPIWAFQDGRSSMLVITALPDGSERAYQFDLTARKAAPHCDADAAAPGCPSDTGTTSGLTFTYPSDVAAAQTQAATEKKRAAIAAWREKEAKAQEAAAIARLKTDVFYGTRNFNYRAKADPQFKFLQPSRVSDNGWLTEMTWPSNVQMPSVAIIDPATGDERVAPTVPSNVGSQAGQMVVVNGTAQRFRLRLGPKAVMDVINLAWSASRPDPGTGTTSPDVVRQVIYKDQARK